jgi:hypothetical protein
MNSPKNCWMFIRYAGTVLLFVVCVQISEPSAFGQFGVRKGIPPSRPGGSGIPLEDSAEHGECLDIIPVNWDLLFFHERRRIREIEVHFEESFVTPLPITIRCSNRKWLNHLEADLARATLRMAIGANRDGGFGSLPVGYVRVACTDGDFIIGINPTGFALGEEAARFQNLFYCYFLAYFLDELFLQKTGRQLPKEPVDLTKSLSGERWLEGRKESWSRWCREVEPKRKECRSDEE